MVLNYLSTWNYKKVNTNLKEASETIDGKHVQGKKEVGMGRKQEVFLIIFGFVSLSVMVSFFHFLCVVERYFSANLKDGVKYFRCFFHVCHRQAGES